MQESISVHRERDVLERDFEQRRAYDREVFAEITDSIDFTTDVNPLSIPLSIWGNLTWEFMDPQKRDQILSSMFRFTLRRGLATMPLYKYSREYAAVTPDDFQSLSDLSKLPVLLKDGDAAAGIPGFRSLALYDPHVLRPTDVISSVPYDSGGTKGLPTPTHITPIDMKIEGLALAHRCFLSGGFHRGTNLYNFYNPSHKGGRLIEDAAKMLGKNHVITRRPEDDLDTCMRKIKSYKTHIIAAVQPPLSPSANNKKGSGVSFINLVGSDHTVFGRKNNGIVQRAFVTGFQLPEPLIQLSQELDFDLFTTWGASEALPGATSTVLGPSNRICVFNNQHLIMGPHVLSVVRFQDGTIVPAKVGETGVILVTTIAREGTLFFNYAIGDKATVVAESCPCGRTTPVIGNIQRVDDPREVIDAGCRFC